ncbi:serine/threonine-protein kinase PknH/PknJ [Mycobacterium angelicum]|uniref:non-specific serine/threonine protein kinase n=1 Tax=Mycobacterium angelicum TaxID=470074 RepID=A0A1W9ZZ22_MYCAN|nr:serine/threonine-protein kinase PknH/PknJ [Mycobacterium angelicum]ORA23040.1 serine/threonine protein kinase [Mycobacterium angelicum]
MLTVGSLVGGYRVERVLGSGGMGTVYLAADPALPRRNALKVLSAELCRDPDFRARFIREADMAAALEHPQIVSVYNRGQTPDGQLWIAMQFVDGTDADDALRNGTMTPHRAVHVIAEVAKALDFAHSRNVMHRDVKPANFLLSGPVGPDERVFLGDFGIARALDDVGLTATGSVLATIAYAAPEVLSNAPIDGRVDIYSLGCSLFRLLTGQTPFSANNGAAAVMSAHLFAPPPRVTDLVHSLPPAFDQVIATAMAKDPAVRFGSAGALAQAAAAALHGVAHGMSLPPVPIGEVSTHQQQFPSPPGWQPTDRGNTPPPTPWGPPAYPSRRRKRTAIGATLAAVALVGAGAVAVSTLHDARPGRAATAPQGAPPGEPFSSIASQPPAATDIAAAELRPTLLGANEIARISGGNPVVLERDDATLLDDAATSDNAQCIGAWAPAEQSVYGTSGYTGVAVQALRALNETAWRDSVTEAVVAFPSQEKAGVFYVNQRGQWGLCGGKTITLSQPGEPAQMWDFGQPLTIAGALTIAATLRGGAASCQHGIVPRGNVIIDIRQCRATGGNDVAALVTATAAKLPRQR